MAGDQRSGGAVDQQASRVNRLALPSPPRALSAIIRASSDPEASLFELSRLISADPVFAAEVLRLANTAFYRRASEVVTVSQAVSTLGLRTLRNVALCTAAKNFVTPKELGGFDIDWFWEDSLRRAVACEMLSGLVAAIDPSEGFTAGLLMDLGVVALVRNQHNLALEWMSHATDEPDKRRGAEAELFGERHDVISGQLANVWKLPSMLSAVMSFHHEPEKAPAEYRQICKLARDAEYLAAVLSCTDKRKALQRARTTLGHWGISADNVDLLIDDLGKRVSEVSEVFGFRVGVQPSLEQILAEANRGLSAMNLSYEELVGKLEQALAEKEVLAAQLAARNQELEQLSITDALTNLPNRRAFDGRLHYELRRASRSGGVLTLMIGDVDHFKKVNDTYGHALGDRVLQNIAQRLSEAVRQTDMVARIGGEEFAVLLPDTDLPGARIVAAKLLQRVSETELALASGGELRVTISLGMTQIRGPYDGCLEVEELATRMYKAADGMLYESKRSGRNRVSEYVDKVVWSDRELIH